MFPDYFNQPCPVCGQLYCAWKYAYYYRPAFTEDAAHFIPDLKIIRYICRTKQVVFSLLPTQLIPYRRQAIPAAAHIVHTRINLKNSLYKTIEYICKRHPVAEELLNIGSSGIYSLVSLFKNSLRKYTTWLEKKTSLEDFVSLCSEKDCRNSLSVATDYYQSNGSYKQNSHFLFGKASQFRFPGS